MSAPERIWAASVTENYGEWQTTTDGLPRPTEYVRADIYAALEAQLAEAWRKEGFLAEKLKQAETERDTWKERAMTLRLSALEAQLAERVKVKPLRWGEYAALNRGRKLVAHDCFGNEFARLDLHENQTATSVLMFKAEHEERYTRLIRFALEATPPAPKVMECATEDCERTATVRFERGGIGSDYCHDCYMRIQALTAAQEEGKL